MPLNKENKTKTNSCKILKIKVEDITEFIMIKPDFKETCKNKN